MIVLQSGRVAQWHDLTETQGPLSQGLPSLRPPLQAGAVSFTNHSLFGSLSDGFSTEVCEVSIVASLQSDGTVVGFYNGSRVNDIYYLRLAVENGQPVFTYGSGAGTVEKLTAPASFVDSGLYVFTFTSDGSQRQFLVNNELMDMSNAPFHAVAQSAQVGSSGAGNYFTGSVAKINFWSRQLSSAERDAMQTYYEQRFLIQALPDITPPLVTSPLLTFLGASTNSITLGFDPASDDQTPQEDLLYRVYVSEENNLNSIEDVDANGALAGEVVGEGPVTATGLNADTPYWLNVLVFDQAGNRSIYTATEQSTTESEPLTGFVTVENGEFKLNGETFRFNSTNAYYLPNYQKEGDHPGDPDMVDRAIQSFIDAEITVVRMWAFYDGYDVPGAYSNIDPRENVIQTAPGVYDEGALQDLDLVIYKLKQAGIRLVLPFVNYWTELGGIAQYNYWAGHGTDSWSNSRMEMFINGSQQQQWYRQYISMLLNRVNTYTGIAYKDEPAIMGWEVMNEGRNPSAGDGGVMLAQFYEATAQYIKSIDSNHLVGTGEEGFDEGTPAQYTVEDYPNTYVLRAEEGTSYILNTSQASIDFGRAHWYPAEFGMGSVVDEQFLTAQRAYVMDRHNIAQSYGKPFFLGEYGLPVWTSDEEQRKLSMYKPLYELVEQEGLAGSMIWQLTADWHKSYEFGGNIHWPGGNRHTELFLEFKRHSKIMNGDPAVSPPVVSNSSVSVEEVTNNDIELSVATATDPEFPEGSIYEMYVSTQNNVADINGALTNGTLAARVVAEPDQIPVVLRAEGLAQNTLYYYNVLVRDPQGNSAMYSPGSVQTEFGDQVPPTLPGDVDVNVTEKDHSSALLTYNEATDDVTAPEDLRYALYLSTTNNLGSSVGQIEANGWKADERIGANELFAIGMMPNTLYYARLVVYDEQNNGSVYGHFTVETEPLPVFTLDETAPMINGLQSYLHFQEGYGGEILDLTDPLRARRTYPEGDGGAWRVVNGRKTWVKRDSNSEWLVLPFHEGMRMAGQQISIAMLISYDRTQGELYNILYRGFHPGFNVGFPGWTDGFRAQIGSVTATTFNQGNILGDLENLHPIVLTVDALDGEIKFYVGGVLVDTISLEEQVSTMERTWDVTIPIPAPLAGFTVQYGALGFWDRELTAQEVADWSANPDLFVLTNPDETPPEVSDPALSASGVGENQVTINFTKASDDVSAQQDLLYELYYSTSSDIGTLEGIDANGTLADSDVDVDSLTAELLAAGVTYWFNVVVSDEAGNRTAYNQISQQTSPPADTTAPVPGGGGALGLGTVTINSIEITFTKGTDDEDPPQDLNYHLYMSESNNLGSTVASVEGNGLQVDSGQDVSSLTASSLNDNQTYWFNVIIEDTSGNKAAYVTRSGTTLEDVDTTPPVPGNDGVLATTGVDEDGFTVTFTRATDNVSSPEELEYELYVSTADDLGTTPASVKGGELMNSAFDTSALVADGLAEDTQYWFNVLVRDQAGNEAVYAGGDVTTALSPDTTPPVPGSGGSLSVNTVTQNSFNVAFTKAVDDRDNQEDLHYSLYYSTSDNLGSTPATIESNGTLADDAVDVSQLSITGLDPDTTYWFNVVVEDTSGNKAAYAGSSQTTEAVPDTTPPTPGGGGSLSFGSVTQNSLIVQFTKATDDISDPEELMYYLYQSSSNNIGSVANAESNGTLVDSMQDVSSIPVSGLDPETTYWYNVIVEDEAGNKAAYTQASQTTAAPPDTDPPTPGGDGVITQVGVSHDQLEFTIVKATDETDNDWDLFYEMYYSTSDDLGSTPESVKSNGTLGDSGLDKSYYLLEGLDPDTDYWINVVVRDTSGNEAIYVTRQSTTEPAPDTTPPVPGGGGTLTEAAKSASSITVSFDKATDNADPQSALEYHLYYSESDNLGSTVSSVETNGTLASSQTDVDSLTASGLSASTQYWLNVVVEDTSGNKAIYSQIDVTTEAPSSGPSIDTNHSMAADLTCYLNFHEGTGTTVEDITGRGNDMTITDGGEWTTIDSEDVWARTETGGGRGVLANHADLNFGEGPFTVGIRFCYDDDNSSWNVVFSKGWHPGYGLVWAGWNNDLGFDIGNVENYFSPGIKGDLTELHTLVFVCADIENELLVYLDGTLIATEDLSQQSSSATSASDLVFGSATATASMFWLNKFATWKRALSAQEVADWTANPDIMLNT